MSEFTDLGITALKEGHREAAFRLLTEAVKCDPRDAVAWLWLSGAVEGDDQRADCLRRVLALEPGNIAARAGLEQIESHRRLAAQCPVCGEAGRITCPKCRGDRTELCSVCQGQTFRKCDVCQGLGWLPGESLALNQSEERWRECGKCSATGLVDCEACRGRGRDWCHTCEGSGQVICPNCAAARLKLILGEPLAKAVLGALWHDRAHARTLLAALQDSTPLVGFLWRVGFADRPYSSTRKLRAWIELHPEDQAGRQLLDLLPEAPYEQLPPREKPVQLLKRQSPTGPLSEASLQTYVLSRHPGNVLNDAIMATRIGNRDQALVLMLQAVEQEPRSEEAWLWLSRLVDTDAQRVECLRRVLDINPGNEAAQAELARLNGDRGSVISDR